MPSRQVADLLALSLVDALVDELRQPVTVAVQHPERAVVAIDQLDSGVHDPARRGVRFEPGRDRENGIEEAVHLISGRDQFLDAVLHLAQQLTWTQLRQRIANARQVTNAAGIVRIRIGQKARLSPITGGCQPRAEK